MLPVNAVTARTHCGRAHTANWSDTRHLRIALPQCRQPAANGRARSSHSEGTVRTRPPDDRFDGTQSRSACQAPPKNVGGSPSKNVGLVAVCVSAQTLATGQVRRSLADDEAIVWCTRGGHFGGGWMSTARPASALHSGRQPPGGMSVRCRRRLAARPEARLWQRAPAAGPAKFGTAFTNQSRPVASYLRRVARHVVIASELAGRGSRSAGATQAVARQLRATRRRALPAIANVAARWGGARPQGGRARGGACCGSGRYRTRDMSRDGVAELSRRRVSPSEALGGGGEGYRPGRFGCL